MRGFYEALGSNRSGLYINSEDEDSQEKLKSNSKSSDKKYNKVVPKNLIVTTSPLRVKNKYEETKHNNFYSADSSNMEKVVVCSVITSGRPEGEDSL